jgi:hypothetical protein
MQFRGDARNGPLRGADYRSAAGSVNGSDAVMRTIRQHCWQTSLAPGSSNASRASVAFGCHLQQDSNAWAQEYCSRPEWHQNKIILF